MSFPISDYFSIDEIQLINKEAKKAEKQGKWTKPLIELGKDKQLFHLFVPKIYGGKQLSLPKAMRWLEASSRLDGSFGWTLTLGAGAGIFGAFMNPNFAREIFSDYRTFIAGSGFSGGTLVKKNGSYLANGQWKYASGIDHATLITANCVIPTNDSDSQRTQSEKPTTKAIACYPREVTLSKQWNSYGLKATGSHNFEINGVMVPESRTFDISPEAAKTEGMLYRYPFIPFARCTLSASLIGMGAGFLSEAESILINKHGVNEFSKLPEQIQTKFIKAKNEYSNGREQLYKQALYSWEKLKKEGLSDDLKSKIARTVRESCQKTVGSVQQIYPLLGMSVINPQSHINRFWRDLHTACQHMLLTPDVHSQK